MSQASDLLAAAQTSFAANAANDLLDVAALVAATSDATLEEREAAVLLAARANLELGDASDALAWCEQHDAANAAALLDRAKALVRPEQSVFHAVAADRTLVELHLAAKEWEPAVALLEGLVRQLPHGAREHFVLAQALHELGRTDEAARSMSTAALLGDEDAIAAVRTAGKPLPDELYRLVAEAEAPLDIAEAHGQLAKLYLDESQASGDTWAKLAAQALADRAMALMRGREGGSALGAAKTVTALRPGWAPGWYVYGAQLVLANRLEDAIAAFQRQAWYTPEDPEPHALQGQCLEQLGRTDEATAAFAKANAIADGA